MQKNLAYIEANTSATEETGKSRTFRISADSEFVKYPNEIKPEANEDLLKVYIDAEELEKAQELNRELVEMAAEHDEALMELYFEKGSLTQDDIRAGLKIGDRILEIEGADAKGFTVSEVSSRLKGDPGSTVTVRSALPQSLSAMVSSPLILVIFTMSVSVPV